MMSSRYGPSWPRASSSSVAKALHAASCTRLFLSRQRCSNACRTERRTCSLFGVCSWQIHCENRDAHQQEMLRSSGFGAWQSFRSSSMTLGRNWMRLSMQPKAMAPRASTPDSCTSQFGSSSFCWIRGRTTSRISCLNALARWSKDDAAAFRAVHSAPQAPPAFPPPSSSSSSSPPLCASLSLWKRGLMSSARSGTPALSSSIIACSMPM
mmetsp:Transcript_47626/g.125721  ORF Transcript_47626/g.125721 Transcript_47626/m.125721 type:complete len:210 (+) Transcript_47626:1226-1855(+)